MKKPLITFAVLFLIYVDNIYAQIIPDSLQVDWSKAGYQGAIPEPSLIINVKNFGAYGDGVHDDYSAIINAMNSSSSLRVIYFPAGNYLIKSSISPSNNVIFRGDGTASNLIFNLSSPGNKNALNISSAQSNVFTAIDSGYVKNSSTLNLRSTSGFTAGSYAEIREANGAWDVVPATWAKYCVGQIVKIISVSSNVITIDQPLRINYDSSLHPEICTINFKTNIGIECLKITRADSTINGNFGYNINFSYAANCWVNGVEFSKSQGSHIMLDASKNITVTGSYFHDAFTYDGTGTAGYGVTMIQHNSDCKVENNVFRHLRHAMMAKQGANGNVFAYNYSLEPYRIEDPHDGGADVVLHGHYPFANLFEGNIGQTIMADATWGPAGPYNTFFRNRAILYGLIISDFYVNTRNEVVIGNEITNTDSLKGYYVLQPNYHFTYGNNIKDTIQPAGTNTLNDVSYYLTSKPYFWNVNSVWPSIGGNNVLGSGTIPAKERYSSGNNIAVCLNPPSSKMQITITADSIKCNGNVSHIVITATGGAQPYTGIGEFYKPAGNYSFVVTDAFGYSDSVSINLNQPSPVTASTNMTASETCKPNGAIAVVNISGGMSPYYFSLNGGTYTTDSVFNNLSYGKYFVIVKDANSCVDSINNIIITSHPTIIITTKTTNASACKNDGSITIKRTGGQSPFKYSIDGINYVSTYTFYNLAAGTYIAWVKDKTGCKDSLKNIVVKSTPAITVSLIKTNVSCKNANDGSIMVKASGGTKPYLYSLDSVNYTSNNTFINLKAGTYTTYVKDAAGCIVTSTAVIKNSNVNCSGLSDITVLHHDLKLIISPNPSTQNFIVSIKNSSKRVVRFYVTDMYGRIIYSVNNQTNVAYRFGENFAPGVYMLRLMQGSNIKEYKLVKQ